jgi:hypothetical protein
LKAVEGQVLRKVFVLEWEELPGQWEKLHNEDFQDLYSSPVNIWVSRSRRMTLAEHVACVGEERSAYREHEGKRPLRRPRQRWEDNIKMDIKEVEWDGVDQNDLAQTQMTHVVTAIRLAQDMQYSLYLHFCAVC